MSLQGGENNILLMTDKVFIKKKKLDIWIGRFEKRNFDLITLANM